MSVHTYNYRFRNPDEIFELSHYAAKYFPDVDRAFTGIYELLINAVEHGNLGIGWETKGILIKENRWEEEIRRRLSLPDYREREVKVELVARADQCRVTITDQGDGFPWRIYTAPSRDIPQLAHGRGILIALHSGFDEVTFNERGNQVSCAVKRA